MYTLPPFLRYSPAISASRCHSTTLCHSVRSCHSPFLSLYRSLVAKVSFATGVPLGVYLTSGSLPRFPIKITLLTLLPAMIASPDSANITELPVGGFVMNDHQHAALSSQHSAHRVRSGLRWLNAGCQQLNAIILPMPADMKAV